jgi:hypothetical protein
MQILEQTRITNMGIEIDTSPAVFGELRRSDDVAGDGASMRARMEEDGYLYFPGCLDRDAVLRVRRETLEQLQKAGILDPAHPLMDGVCRPDVELKFSPELVAQSASIRKVLYAGPLMRIMECFFGEPVRHFDYTWYRTVSKGKATQPHCDIVYMGRGTRQLYTAWVPYGEVPVDLGGLMVLENSHKVTPVRCANYLKKDVDTYCVNRPAPNTPKPNSWLFDGTLSKRPDLIRAKLGGRWLTANYQPGDFIMFGMALVHAGLDNHTHRLRLSSDSRYQKASEPADERWIGENPPGHGPHVHKGVIC